MQIQMFDSTPQSLQRMNLEGRSSIELEYSPHVWDENQSSILLSRLLKEIDWHVDEIRIFGKVRSIPRMTAWYGDSDAIYVYSGIKNVPLPWSPLISEIRQAVQRLTGQVFNSVLLNRYRSGTDYMSWHSDDELELGPEPLIASVSFGKTRTFEFRPKSPSLGKNIKLNLESGSLLVMRGTTQKNWEHRVAKDKKINPGEERVNLTFRQIYPRTK